MQAELVNEQLIEACTQEPQSFDNIRKLVESCPDAVTMRNSLRLFDRDGDECIIEGYPLHFAVLNETVSLQVVEYLVEQFPRAVKEPNFAYERLPLHFACLNEAASHLLVPYLVKQWPDSVKEPSADGRLPLHLVCLNKAISQEIVQYLVEQWPDAVKTTNSYDHHLPLHSAVRDCYFHHLAVVSRCRHNVIVVDPTHFLLFIFLYSAGVTKFHLM
jgi:hypothetical protein